jgi:hypothetical protein
MVLEHLKAQIFEVCGWNASTLEYHVNGMLVVFPIS